MLCPRPPGEVSRSSESGFASRPRARAARARPPGRRRRSQALQVGIDEAKRALAGARDRRGLRGARVLPGRAPKS
jgi:hypothetical protein